MPNDISLTVRLPHDLNEQMKSLSKGVGLSRTSLIRSAVHDFLTVDNIKLDFSPNSVDKKDRLVLNLNQLTYDILETACKKYNQSMNAVVVAVSILASERAAKWLEAVKQ